MVRARLDRLLTASQDMDLVPEIVGLSKGIHHEGPCLHCPASACRNGPRPGPPLRSTRSAQRPPGTPVRPAGSTALSARTALRSAEWPPTISKGLRTAHRINNRTRRAVLTIRRINSGARKANLTIHRINSRARKADPTIRRISEGASPTINKDALTISKAINKPDRNAAR